MNPVAIPCNTTERQIYCDADLIHVKKKTFYVHKKNIIKFQPFQYVERQ